jgi:hypothetical protein
MKRSGRDVDETLIDVAARFPGTVTASVALAERSLQTAPLGDPYMGGVLSFGAIR